MSKPFGSAAFAAVIIYLGYNFGLAILELFGRQGSGGVCCLAANLSRLFHRVCVCASL